MYGYLRVINLNYWVYWTFLQLQGATDSIHRGSFCFQWLPALGRFGMESCLTLDVCPGRTRAQGRSPDFCDGGFFSTQQEIGYQWENIGTYCGWLRNLAPPKGWLKPDKSWVKPSTNWCRISCIHSRGINRCSDEMGISRGITDRTWDKSEKFNVFDGFPEVNRPTIETVFTFSRLHSSTKSSASINGHLNQDRTMTEQMQWW